MNWRAQLAAWTMANQKSWREYADMLATQHPAWTPDYCEFVAFRQVRDVMLSEKAISLQTAWPDATGEARTWEEIQALPRDDSEERLQRARKDWEDRRRAAANDAAEKDEPRRQNAWKR